MNSTFTFELNHAIYENTDDGECYVTIPGGNRTKISMDALLEAYGRFCDAALKKEQETFEKERITRDSAIVYLVLWGWNKAGAEAIVEAAIEDGTFKEMTFGELVALHNEYESR